MPPEEPEGPRARLELRHADWAGAWHAATAAVELGRRGAGRMELVTPNTLKTHLRAIYRKLGAESREEAGIRAREDGPI
jgi:transposase-like protein